MLFRSAGSMAFISAAIIASASPCFAKPKTDTSASKKNKRVYLDTINLEKATQSYRRPGIKKSVDDNKLSLGGKTFARGIGAHATFDMPIDLGDGAKSFHAVVGVDDEKRGSGSVKFQIVVDGKSVKETKILRGGDKPIKLKVDLSGAKSARLVVSDAGDGTNSDHADWANAYFVVSSKSKNPPHAPEVSQAPELPIAAIDNTKLRINGARIVGATPGRPFMYLIPATGKVPITYEAAGLPDGLILDSKTGVITGKIDKAGTTTVQLSAKDSSGSVQAPLTIVSGEHKLSLTPAMGWNSWNVWGKSVDAEKIKAAADSLVESGLAAHGFQYINIDDAWEAGRDDQGRIESNEHFPDMKALSDYVHSKGLKLGIYSSPGPMTCGDFTGSWKHEKQDAERYAEWGIDYLKYDWCSYREIATPDSVEKCKKPYEVMRKALDSINRDIVYSLCQYGMQDVWKWGADVGGNSWRTTGDIRDNWGSMSRIGFSQDEAAPYAEPGHWNDPDMLVVGKVGWGPSVHPTGLTHNEQITHISLWSLLASPLLIGCDMTSMDDFTINLLSNDEVLAIDQDMLGQAARRRSVNGQAEVWSRQLADGTAAVGLFNRGWHATEVEAKWSDISVSGPQNVRDLWQQKDLGVSKGSFKISVPAHGCVLVKIGKPNK